MFSPTRKQQELETSLNDTRAAATSYEEQHEDMRQMLHKKQVIVRNPLNQEILVPDWLITSHVI